MLSACPSSTNDILDAADHPGAVEVQRLHTGHVRDANTLNGGGVAFWPSPAGVFSAAGLNSSSDTANAWARGSCDSTPYYRASKRGWRSAGRLIIKVGGQDYTTPPGALLTDRGRCAGSPEPSQPAACPAARRCRPDIREVLAHIASTTSLRG